MFSDPIKTCNNTNSATGGKCGRFCKKGETLCMIHSQQSESSIEIFSDTDSCIDTSVSITKSIMQDIENMDKILFETDMRNYISLIDNIFNPID